MPLRQFGNGAKLFGADPPQRRAGRDHRELCLALRDDANRRGSGRDLALAFNRYG